jgi:hypothetical protein
MKTILLIAIPLVILWMAYEIWSAPLMEETDDGRLIVKRPQKKFKDLFKSKKKNNESATTKS